jgi:hypothetical protein
LYFEASTNWLTSAAVYPFLLPRLRLLTCCSRPITRKFPQGIYIGVCDAVGFRFVTYVLASNKQLTRTQEYTRCSTHLNACINQGFDVFEISARNAVGSFMITKKELFALLRKSLM